MAKTIDFPANLTFHTDSTKSVFAKDLKKILRIDTVAYFDKCCPETNNPNILPVSFDGEEEVLNYFNGTEYVAVPLDGGTGDFGSITTNSIGSEGDGVAFTAPILTDVGIVNVTGLSRYVPFISISVQNNIAAGAGGALTLNNYLTTINTDAGGDAFTLADGIVVGQLKKVHLIADGGGNAVITPGNLAGGTTVTLDDAGDHVVFLWDGDDWNVIENIGGTLA